MKNGHKTAKNALRLMKIDMDDHWAPRNPKLRFFLKFGQIFLSTLLEVWKTDMLKSQGDRNEFWPKNFFPSKVHQKRNFLSPSKKYHFLIWPRKNSFENSKFQNFNFFPFFRFFSIFWHIFTLRQNSGHILLIFDHLCLWISVEYFKLSFF